MGDNLPIVGILGAVSLLLLVTAGLALTGVFGFVGGSSDAVSTETAIGGPATETAADGTASPDETATPPFSLETGTVEHCGALCRNVTSTVTNRQSTAAADVTVTTRLYPGNDTGGAVLYQGVERVGRLEAGGSYTATRRIELELSDAMEIQEAGGWVTIRTTVQSDDRRLVVTDRQQVV